MNFKSHKSLLMLAALLFVSSAQAATKLYTEYIVSTNGTTIYKGETSPNRLGIVYTKESHPNMDPYGDGISVTYINYYVDGKDGKKYYALAGAVREDDFDDRTTLPYPDEYRRIVEGTTKHYAYSYVDSRGEWFEFLDWSGYERECTRNDIPTVESAIALMTTNKWDSYPEMEFPDSGTWGITYNVDAPAYQTYIIDYECEISYNGGEGAEGSMPSQTVTNSAVVASNEFEKTGHRFDCWKWLRKDGTTSKYYPGNIVSVSNLAEDIEFVAQWSKNTYTNIFNANGGTGGKTNILEYGDSLVAPTVSRVGYTHTGWSPAVPATLPASNATYTAQWTANTYTVTLDRQSGIGGTAEVAATYNSAMPSVIVPTRTGHTFGGYWTEQNGGGTQYYDANGLGTATWDKDKDTTLYANWEADSYTLTINWGYKDKDDVAVKTVTNMEYGACVPRVTVPNRKGYTCIGVFDDDEDRYYDQDGNPVDAGKSGEWSGPLVLTAAWNPNPIVIEFEPCGGDIVGKTSITVRYGRQYGELPSASREHFIFDGWWTDETDGVQILATDIVAYTFGPRLLYAHWIKDERFEITFDPTDGVLNTTNVVVYTNGVAYSWLPTPESTNNLFFAGWWTSTDPTNRVQQLPDMVATNTIDKLYARWKVQPPEIPVVISNAVINTVVTNYCVWGTEFRSLMLDEPTPPDGYSFAWWCFNDGKPVADDFVITNDMELTPRYTNTDISKAVGVPELAFELHRKYDSDGYWYPPEDGIIRSGSINSVKGTTSLTAYMRFPGAIGFDYSAYLAQGSWGKDAFRWYLDGNGSPIKIAEGGENKGSKSTNVTDSVKWEVVSYNLVCYAILSNINYQPIMPDWISEWSSTNSADSTLKLVTAPERGVLSFKWRVYGETGYTDTNGVYRLCDYLKFYDESGTELKIEGFMSTNDFESVAITNTTAAAHTFSWRYVKDIDVDVGEDEDAAWVWDIKWEPNAATIEYEYEAPDGTSQKLAISVPNEWVDEYGLKELTGASDYRSALTNLSAFGKVDCGGAALPYWADFIFGTDPTNSASIFTVTNISITAGVVELGWNPRLDDRDYKVWGKTNLVDAAWHSPTNSSTRFFMVEVLPLKSE